MGSRNSMPAASAICARRKLFSHEASQRSGTLVGAMPPEQFGEKIPSFSLLALNMVVGDCCWAEDMNLARWYDDLDSGSRGGIIWDDRQKTRAQFTIYF